MSDYNSLNQFMTSNELNKPKEKWLAIWWSDWTEWKIIQPITDLESLKKVCQKFFYNPENNIADDQIELTWFEKDGKWYGSWLINEETFDEFVTYHEMTFELQKVEVL